MKKYLYLKFLFLFCVNNLFCLDYSNYMQEVIGSVECGVECNNIGLIIGINQNWPKYIGQKLLNSEIKENYTSIGFMHFVPLNFFNNIWLDNLMWGCKLGVGLKNNANWKFWKINPLYLKNYCVYFNLDFNYTEKHVFCGISFEIGKKTQTESIADSGWYFMVSLHARGSFNIKNKCFAHILARLGGSSFGNTKENDNLINIFYCNQARSLKIDYNEDVYNLEIHLSRLYNFRIINALYYQDFDKLVSDQEKCLNDLLNQNSALKFLVEMPEFLNEIFSQYSISGDFTQNDRYFLKVTDFNNPEDIKILIDNIFKWTNVVLDDNISNNLLLEQYKDRINSLVNINNVNNAEEVERLNKWVSNMLKKEDDRIHLINTTEEDENKKEERQRRYIDRLLGKVEKLIKIKKQLNEADYYNVNLLMTMKYKNTQTSESSCNKDMIGLYIMNQQALITSDISFSINFDNEIFSYFLDKMIKNTMQLPHIIFAKVSNKNKDQSESLLNAFKDIIFSNFFNPKENGEKTITFIESCDILLNCQNLNLSSNIKCILNFYKNNSTPICKKHSIDLLCDFNILFKEFLHTNYHDIFNQIIQK